MPKKCYYKPNRTKPRYFKPCDVTRIAQNCVKDNKLPPQEVLACVALGLGFKYVALDRVKQDETVDAKAVDLSKTVTLAKRAVVFVQGLLYRLKQRDLAAKLGAVIEVLDRVVQFLDRTFFRPTTADAEKIADSFGNCNCKWRKKNGKVNNNGAQKKARTGSKA